MLQLARVKSLARPRADRRTTVTRAAWRIRRRSRRFGTSTDAYETGIISKAAQCLEIGFEEKYLGILRLIGGISHSEF